MKIAFIGMGGRGLCLLEITLLMEDIETVAICDTDPEKFGPAFERFDKAGKPRPAVYTDYKKLYEEQNIEAVVIATSWNAHVPAAVDAMKRGIYAGIEVGGAGSIEECNLLVRTFEETGTPCMMLENCCYGRLEMTALNLIHQGKLGEMLYCEGAYQHDLRELVYSGITTRTDHCQKRNADLYPTHELGPIMKALGINRGNRFLSLTSTACKSRAMKEYADITAQPDKGFKCGDMVNTILRCANGETVVLYYSITLPQPYSRRNRYQGTKGLVSEEGNQIYLDGISPKETWEPIAKYEPEYLPQVWKELDANPKEEGHGGMDYLIMRAFYEAAMNKTETPIDVYDTAVLAAITSLSEISIHNGCEPVEVPDFTNGLWVTRGKEPHSKYALDTEGAI